MLLVIILSLALACGIAASSLRLPPMIGFLICGFALQAISTGALPTPLTIAPETYLPGLNTVADVGVTILLFTIGLKLNLRSLLRPEVIGTTIAHMIGSTIIWAGVFSLLALSRNALFAGATIETYLLLGFSLAFSSTIFVVKTLDEHGEGSSRFGMIAIGVLVLQDLVAAIYMGAAKGQLPSPWALALLAALIPARWVILRILDRVGRGELLVVVGIVLALGGYQIFELVGLKGDLGAIIIGALIAKHHRAKLLAERLFSIRELLLVGFFLSIGQYGLPGLPSLTVATVLTLMLPIQTLIYLLIFKFTRLRVRTAAKSALLLTNYSEFGLIAGLVAVRNGWLPQRWMVALALAVTLSFIVATIIDRNRTPLVNFMCTHIPDLPDDKLLPEERPLRLDGINAVVFGMGDVGLSAYNQLTTVYGYRVRGIEQNLDTVAELAASGHDIIEGDASDPTLWERIKEVHDIEVVILAMPDHDGNTEALQQLEQSHIDAYFAAVCEDEEQRQSYLQAGANLVIDVYSGVGAELVDASMRKLKKTPTLPPDPSTPRQ